jgi:hypothetical protein
MLMKSGEEEQPCDGGVRKRLDVCDCTYDFNCCWSDKAFAHKVDKFEVLLTAIRKNWSDYLVAGAKTTRRIV